MLPSKIKAVVYAGGLTVHGLGDGRKNLAQIAIFSFVRFFEKIMVLVLSYPDQPCLSENQRQAPASFLFLTVLLRACARASM